jgi:NAD(P)-dependent dehydrogenase (short-subunit alcohol dehydrogenase family)
MDLGLTGKTAVVTGGSKGIGLAVVRGLVGVGVHVVTGAKQTSADLDELTKSGPVQAINVDLAERSGPGTLVEAAGDRVDILVFRGAEHRPDLVDRDPLNPASAVGELTGRVSGG